MKAIVQNDYGSPDVLELKEIDKPVVKNDGVLVRVHAAAVHAGDYFAMRGMPVTRYSVCATAPAPSMHVLEKTSSC
jgi:NADPH:quinone reductase-like Zn-dependent oxidoreductase